MYTFFKSVGFKKVFSNEAPSFSVSLLLAEAFYKFGSFILEAAAFLCTWYVISLVHNEVIMSRRSKLHKTSSVTKGIEGSS